MQRYFNQEIALLFRKFNISMSIPALKNATGGILSFF